MSVTAVGKSIRIAPRKMSVVASLVRDRTVDDALAILQHTPRRSAIAVRKVIESAVANADYNHSYKPETLRITEITVTPGTRYKRYRPAAFGRARPYQLKTSHITVKVDGDKRQPKKKSAKTTAKKEAK